MSRDFKSCIDKKKLYRSDAAKTLSPKELRSAGDDLAEAKLGLSQRRYKWATIQAYYAMFHAARALLYSRGYLERSNFCVVAGSSISSERRSCSISSGYGRSGMPCHCGRTPTIPTLTAPTAPRCR